MTAAGTGGGTAASLWPRSLLSVVRTKLKVIAVSCLFMTAVLASVVAHSRAPYGFEDPVLNWLGRSSAANT